MTARRPNLAPLIAIALSALLLDLVTKAIALRLLSLESVDLLPMLGLRLGFNPGISFGLLADAVHTNWISLLTGAMLAVLLVLGRWATGIERAGYALIVGGGFANVADRLHDGLVTDFIDLHAAGWHFPTFNFADVAITFGAILLGLHALNLPAFSRQP